VSARGLGWWPRARTAWQKNRSLTPFHSAGVQQAGEVALHGFRIWVKYQSSPNFWIEAVPYLGVSRGFPGFSPRRMEKLTLPTPQ
jgi:hypothetical protein